MSSHLCQEGISAWVGLFLSEIWSLDASPDVRFLFRRPQDMSGQSKERIWVEKWTGQDLTLSTCMLNKEGIASQGDSANLIRSKKIVEGHRANIKEGQVRGRWNHDIKSDKTQVIGNLEEPIQCNDRDRRPPCFCISLEQSFLFLLRVNERQKNK